MLIAVSASGYKMLVYVNSFTSKFAAMVTVMQNLSILKTFPIPCTANTITNLSEMVILTVLQDSLQLLELCNQFDMLYCLILALTVFCFWYYFFVVYIYIYSQTCHYAW